MEAPLHAQDAISARNEQQSPLLRLPAELRNQIYTYLFGGLIWEYRPSHKHEEMDHAMRGTRRHLALLMTCRQFHAETATMAFSLSRFLFQKNGMDEFVGALTAEQRTAINRVQIKFAWEDRMGFLCMMNILMSLARLPGLKRVEVDIREEWEEIVRRDWLGSPRHRLTQNRMRKYVKGTALYGKIPAKGRYSRVLPEFPLVEDEVKGYLREAVQAGGNADTKRIISFGTAKREKPQ